MRGHLLWRLRAVVRPPVTFGVRCMLFDGDNRVLLVRHTYMDGWHFPGGGVDPGESAREAAVRELFEETGLRPSEPPTFFGLYWNKALSGRDHVACFLARESRGVEPAEIKAQAMEIAEAAMFPLDALPERTVRPVRERLIEIAEGTAPAVDW